MIIVSQEKARIANFNNIIQIYVTFDEDDDYVWIRYEGINNSYEDLGRYKTEGRAKEVLQEIIDKFMEYGQIQNFAGDIKQVCEIPKKYEMPKE